MDTIASERNCINCNEKPIIDTASGLCGNCYERFEIRICERCSKRLTREDISCEYERGGASFWDDATIIHQYTREQALADGELVDINKLAFEAGFRFHVAMTRTAWQMCIEWSEADTDRTGYPQDETGRTWDVLMALRYAIKSAGHSSNLLFHVLRVCRDDGVQRLAQLKSACGPGDNGEPVITIMPPGEG